MIKEIEMSKKIKTLKGLTLSELQDYFKSINEPKFRAEQVFKWMYGDLLDDFGDMRNIPKSLRKKLSTSFKVNTLEYSTSEISPSTKTNKFIFKTEDGYKIESVIIPEQKRTTLCISTQVGCPLDCRGNF